MRIDNKDVDNENKEEPTEESFAHLFRTIALELRNIRKGHIPSLEGRVTHQKND